MGKSSLLLRWMIQWLGTHCGQWHCCLIPISCNRNLLDTQVVGYWKSRTSLTIPSSSYSILVLSSIFIPPHEIGSLTVSSRSCLHRLIDLFQSQLMGMPSWKQSCYYISVMPKAKSHLAFLASLLLMSSTGFFLKTRLILKCTLPQIAQHVAQI